MKNTFLKSTRIFLMMFIAATNRLPMGSLGNSFRVIYHLKKAKKSGSFLKNDWSIPRTASILAILRTGKKCEFIGPR